jgi:protein TonB
MKIVFIIKLASNLIFYVLPTLCVIEKSVINKTASDKPTLNRKQNNQLLFCLAATFLFVMTTSSATGTTLTLGTESSSTYKIAEPIYYPKPEIDAELKEQCCKFACTARFTIKADGKVSVALLTSSGSPEVDDVALTTLSRWRFKPATLDGKPVDSTRKIRVEFEVE